MCDQAEELESALAYHCFGVQTPHSGRTPTYTSLQEIKEEGAGCVLLEVVYNGKDPTDFNGTVRYRRCSSDDVWFPGHAQEQILPNDNWASL